MSQFVFNGIAVGGPNPNYSEKFTVDVATGYPRFETVQSTTTDLIDGPYMSVYPDPSYDTENPAFLRSLYSTDFDGTLACSHMEGFNLTQGGTLIDATKPGIGHFVETNYLSNYADPGRLSDTLVSEWHLIFQNPTSYGNAQNRPITFLGQFNTATRTPSNHQLGFNVAQLFHKVNDGDASFLWRCDSTQGFEVNDIPLATEHTNVAARHIVLNGPSGQTAKFLSVNKNSTEIVSLSPWGELLIEGTAAGAGTGDQTAMLKVRGRTGTGSVVQFQGLGGATFFDMSANGADLVIGSALYQRGIFRVQNGGSSVFEVQNTSGQIWTNQATATGPAGAVVGKVPFYDATGVLIGYAELKALS